MTQSALTRLYERHGVTALINLGVAWCYLVAVTSGFLVLYAAAKYIGASSGEMVPYFAAIAICVAVFIPLGAFLLRDRLGDLRSWSSAERTPAAAARVWRAAVALPRRFVIRNGIVIYLVVLATVPVWLSDFDQPAWVYLPMVVIWALLIGAFGLYAMVGLEFICRPIVRDAASHLPADFQPASRQLHLRTKAIIPVPGTILLAVMLTGGFVDSTESYGTKIMVGLGLALASAGVAIGLLLLASHATLDPVDDLTEATRRVREGDLRTPVPVLSDDELGELAVSFNEMLAGLRERDSLREHNTELLNDVRASRARIVATADAERRRMERDIHDGAQQRLVLLSLKLAMLSRHVADSPEARALVDELRADAGLAIEELRDLAHGIYPALLESDGLAGALEDVGDRSTFPVSVTCRDVGRYEAEVEAAVYFCCLEAVQNCSKHAGAGSRVSIDVQAADGHLLFEVSDDGRGFDRASVNGSAGLQNMTDRITALGGRLQIRSEPGTGTTVEGAIPLS
ncbi:MAG TPA: HAMP domain-containing protein [Nocardioidaceae bacterium]|nr:HAMP domain-containing protein [Nocardioidaceae bacterium]